MFAYFNTICICIFFKCQPQVLKQLCSHFTLYHSWRACDLGFLLHILTSKYNFTSLLSTNASGGSIPVLVMRRIDLDRSLFLTKALLQ